MMVRCQLDWATGPPRRLVKHDSGGICQCVSGKDQHLNL